MLAKVDRLGRVHEGYSRACVNAIDDILALTSNIRANLCADKASAKSQLTAVYVRAQEGIKRYHAELSKFIKDVDKMENPNLTTRFSSEHAHIDTEVLGLIVDHFYLSGMPGAGAAVEVERRVQPLLGAQAKLQHVHAETVPTPGVCITGESASAMPAHIINEKVFAASICNIVRDLDAGSLASAEDWISERLHSLRSHRPIPSDAEPLRDGEATYEGARKSDGALKEDKTYRDALLGLAFDASRIRYLQLVDAQVAASEHSTDTTAQAATILDFGRLCFEPFVHKHPDEVCELLWLAITFGSPKFTIPSPSSGLGVEDLPSYHPCITATPSSSSSQSFTSDYIHQFKTSLLQLARRMHASKPPLQQRSAIELITRTGVTVAPEIIHQMSGGGGEGETGAGAEDPVEGGPPSLVLPDALFELEDRGQLVDWPPSVPRFHSVFCCPVSKLMASPGINYECEGVQLMCFKCGHVFLQSSVDALHTRAAVAVQCPTCNQTASKARAMKLVF